VYFAMARDGLFFAPAARVHPHHRTPAFATWMQAGWSCLLVVTGTFGQLVDYTGFSVILFSAVAVGGLFVLRRREPDAPRPFSALGYPVAPAIFVVVSLAIVVNAIVSNPGPSLAGVGIILAGVPLYLWFSARRRVA
jgi:APA family basic amino acid/polyamine antiporter